MYDAGSDEPATFVYSACVTAGASPWLESARTTCQPGGGLTYAAEGTRTSSAASMTSPDTTPEGLGSVSERTLRSAVAVDIPRRAGAGAVAAWSAAAPGERSASATSRANAQVVAANR